MQIIILAAIACIIGGINHNFYGKFLKPRFKNEVIIYLNWTIVIIGLFALAMKVEKFYFIWISSIIMNIFMTFTQYKGNYKKILILTLTVGLLTMAVGIMVRHIFFMLEMDFFDNIELSLSLASLIMYIFLKLTSKFYKVNDKYYQNKAIFLLISILASILILDTSLLLNIYIDNPRLHMITVLSTLLLIVIFLLLIYFYFRALEAAEKLKEIGAIENQIQLYKDYIKDYEAMEEHRKRIRHDTKQYLITIENLVRNREYDRLNKYIKDLNAVHYLNGNITTGNISVDAILNHYKWKINHLDIRFTYELKIPSNLNINDMDIGVVLGNLMENAIEAVENGDFSEKDKRIFLSIKFIAETLIIQIKNPYKNRLIKDRKGGFKTTKKNSLDHGIGLKTVKSIVDTYDGDMKLRTGEMFEAYVLLYLNLEEDSEEK